MRSRLAVTALLLLVSAVPVVAEDAPATPPTDVAKLADTPEHAFQTLRHCFSVQDFTHIWHVVTDENRQQVLEQMSQIYQLAGMLDEMKKSKSAGDQAFAKALERLTRKKSIDELRQLTDAQKTALVYALLDAQFRQPGMPLTGTYKIFQEGTKVVGQQPKADQATLVLENEWKYRRKRSEMLLKKEGGTWRYITARMHTVGKFALGTKGFSISEEKKKELVATVEALIRKPSNPHSRSLFDITELTEISEIGPLAIAPAIAALMDEKSSEDRKTRAIRVLSALGEEAAGAVPTLRAMLGNKEPSTVVTGCEVLRNLGRAGAEAVPDLIKHTKGKDETLVLRAVQTLGAISERAELVVPALIELTQKDSKARPAAILVLGVFADDAPAALGALKKMLGHKDEKIAGTACIALAEAGKAASQALPELIALVRNKETGASGQAANALGRLRLSPEQSVPALIDAVEKNPLAREQALQALAAFGSDAAPAVEALKKLLKDEKPSIRGGAALVLSTIGPAALVVLDDINAAAEAETDRHVSFQLAAAVKKLEALIPPAKKSEKQPEKKSETKTEKKTEAE